MTVMATEKPVPPLTDRIAFAYAALLLARAHHDQVTPWTTDGRLRRKTISETIARIEGEMNRLLEVHYLTILTADETAEPPTAV